jgi:hypothetical protein
MSLLEDARGSQADLVMTMPSLSKASIEAHALEVLRAVDPRALERPTYLDLSRWVDFELPKLGIHFYPVEDVQMPTEYARTLPAGDVGDPIEVLIRRSEWDALHAGGRGAHHARGTVVHELGHAFQHVESVRQRRAQGLALPRHVSASTVKAYEDPEWQAWCFGTCIIAPRTTILMGATRSATALADIYGTSIKLMRMHLNRLGIGGR